MMPKKADGTGRIWIETQNKHVEVLHLDELPWGNSRPLEMGRPQVYIPGRRRGSGGAGTIYRLRMQRPVGWQPVKDPTISFGLSSKHINETLFYLADFWRYHEVPFQCLLSKNGAIFNNALLSGDQFIANLS